MRTYLYNGTDKSRDLIRLAVSAASLRMPIYVVSFGPTPKQHPLASHAKTLDFDLVQVRFPGWGLPDGPLPMSEIAVQASLAVLREIIASGDHDLVILDGVRAAVAQGLVEVADLYRLVRSAPDGVEIALT